MPCTRFLARDGQGVGPPCHGNMKLARSAQGAALSVDLLDRFFCARPRALQGSTLKLILPVRRPRQQTGRQPANAGHRSITTRACLKHHTIPLDYTKLPWSLAANCFVQCLGVWCIVCQQAHLLCPSKLARASFPTSDTVVAGRLSIVEIAFESDPNWTFQLYDSSTRRATVRSVKQDQVGIQKPFWPQTSASWRLLTSACWTSPWQTSSLGALVISGSPWTSSTRGSRQWQPRRKPAFRSRRRLSLL